MSVDALIVGAGFAGCICAERLAAKGWSVLLIDRRSHIAGNAFDGPDQHGVLVHWYGPHIFHTSSAAVFQYLSQFTDWNFYEHRVLARVNGNLFPIPINRTTLNLLYDKDLTEEEAVAFLEKVRVPKTQIRTSEDVVLNTVGHDLCDKFFRGYTRKQWGVDLSELSSAVTSRIPTRTNDDDRYFTDAFQFMPKDSFTRMFERMLDRPGIELELNTEFENIRDAVKPQLTIYTGRIDAYFNYCLGQLPYRSLRFEHEYVHGRGLMQPVATINYPNDYEFTRTTEFRHLTGQQHAGTSLVREYPAGEGDPYYPFPTPQNEALYQQYARLAKQERNVFFVGRLAQYRYMNMDQVAATALDLAETLLRSAA